MAQQRPQNDCFHRSETRLHSGPMQPTELDTDRLLDAICTIQELYFSGPPSESLYTQVLDQLLQLTGSDFGLIATPRHSGSGNSLEVKAIAGHLSAALDRDQPGNDPADWIGKDGLALLDRAIRDGAPVFRDERSDQVLLAGPGERAPGIRSFAALPIMRGDAASGVAVLANREHDFDRSWAGFLEPLLRTSSHLFHAMEYGISDIDPGQAGSAARYRTLLDLSPDAIVTFADGRYIDCNQATLDLFGLKDVAELRAMKVGDFSPPRQPDGRDSAAAARAYFEQSLQQGQLWFDWTYRSRTGHEFPSRVFLSARSTSRARSWCRQ